MDDLTDLVQADKPESLIEKIERGLTEYFTSVGKDDGTLREVLKLIEVAGARDEFDPITKCKGVVLCMKDGQTIFLQVRKL